MLDATPGEGVVSPSTNRATVQPLETEPSNNHGCTVALLFGGMVYPPPFSFGCLLVFYEPLLPAGSVELREPLLVGNVEQGIAISRWLAAKLTVSKDGIVL